MTSPPGELERFDAGVGRVLRTGVLMSSVLMGLGLLAWLLDVAAAAALLNAGLVSLMATPVVRLLASLIEYLRTREWSFVWMTGAVVIILAGTVLYAVIGR